MNKIIISTIVFAMFSGFADSQTTNASPNFQSCRIAERYREEYRKLQIENPDSYYSCDQNSDSLHDLIANYRFKSKEKAIEQYLLDEAQQPC